MRFKRRSVASRSRILFGIKICAVFSLFILYHLLDQEKKTSSRVQEKLRSGARKETIRNSVTTGDIRKLQARISNNALIQTLNGSSVNHRRFSFSIANQRAEPDMQQKFIFVLHHYEQLAKTTENLIQLAEMAKRVGRVLVEPFVRDSRMCGLPYGWYGQQRSESRRFHPLSLYYDVQFMNNLLSNTSRHASMVPLDFFKRECRSNIANTTLLHFIYSDQNAEDMKRLYDTSETVYREIQQKTKQSGWCDCNFIDSGLNVSGRIGDIRVQRQICIDAEKVKSLPLLENEIIQKDKCVVIIHWRGFGEERTHFEPEVEVDNRKLVHSLQPSELILQQAEKLKKSIGEEYISVHIRSERQIKWYSVERLLRCLKVLVANVAKIKQKHRLKKIFLSSDFTRFGSDTLHAFTAQNKTLIAKLKKLARSLLKTLKPVQYDPNSKNSLVMDGGVVALTEMNILFGGSHLITIGSGTFQQWIVDVFIERKSALKTEQQHWTVTRICNKEGKSKLKSRI